MDKILSIAVPSYNVEQYLEKGLTSYCDHRLEENLEIIIVNDGSIDATAQLAEEFTHRYPSIFRLVNKKNGGHGSAINAGLAQATGRYFRIVDGDDWVNTENLVCLIEHLKKTDTDLVIDVKNEVHMSTGKTTLFPIPDYVPKQVPCNFEDICGRDDIGSYIMIHTLSAKTDFLKQQNLQLLERTFYVDYEYLIKATAAARNIEFIDLEIYQYLVGNINQSVSDTNYVKRWADHTRVTEETLRFITNFLVSNTCSPLREEYLVKKACLLINTHYNISLIFDHDRAQGVRRAKEFRIFLQNTHPTYAKATDKRYFQDLVLHYLGFNSQKKLDTLTRQTQ